jgi:hypothetical protein
MINPNKKQRKEKAENFVMKPSAFLYLSQYLNISISQYHITGLALYLSTKAFISSTICGEPITIEALSCNS